jgi:hypothetical protein
MSTIAELAREFAALARQVRSKQKETNAAVCRVQKHVDQQAVIASRALSLANGDLVFARLANANAALNITGRVTVRV